MPEQMMRIVDVAELLGVSKQAVWKRYRDGRLPEPEVLAGSAPLWKPETIEAWQENRPDSGA